MFIHFKHKWASGHGQEDYRLLYEDDLEDGEPTRELLDSITEENNWSDKYRGIDYDLVERPPQKWLDREKRNTLLRIQGLYRYYATLGDDMATAPDDYTKVRTSVMYCSPSHGKFIIYVDRDVICANWESIPSSAPGTHDRWEPTQRHNCKIWRNGEFLEDELQGIAMKCSSDVATMIHWIKEEVIKFASAVLPIPEDE